MVKYEERLMLWLPFTGSKYFFFFFFFFFLLESDRLFVFVSGLFGWFFLFFFFLFLAPRGLTNIWILLDDEQCLYSRGIVYFNS